MLTECLLVPDTQGDIFSFPQPALDLVFASLDEISPMLYQYERTRAIEEEKNDPGRRACPHTLCYQCY